MKILIRALSTNPDCVTCDYAVLDLNPMQVAARIALAKDVNRQDPAMSELSFYEYTASYFESFDDELMLEALTPAQRAAIDTDEYILVADDFNPKAFGADDAIRTEGEHIAIMPAASADGAVYWSARDKYSETSYETRSIPFAVIERMAGGAS